MNEGIQSEVISTTRFDQNSDLSTTYLGRIYTTRASKIKAEEKFPISEQGYMIGRLLNVTECQILLDTGVRKSFMSKLYNFWCKSLYLLPKFASKTQRIQVGNGQFVSVLFIIPQTICSNIPKGCPSLFLSVHILHWACVPIITYLEFPWT